MVEFPGSFYFLFEFCNHAFKVEQVSMADFSPQYIQSSCSDAGVEIVGISTWQTPNKDLGMNERQLRLPLQLQLPLNSLFILPILLQWSIQCERGRKVSQKGLKSLTCFFFSDKFRSFAIKNYSVTRDNMRSCKLLRRDESCLDPQTQVLYMVCQVLPWKRLLSAMVGGEEWLILLWGLEGNF